VKIVNATVLDPRKEGEYRNPQLQLVVDEEIIETREPIVLKTFVQDGTDFDYVITPHGPFFAVDHVLHAVPGDVITAADIGQFNSSGLWESRLVDVIINSPEHEYELSMGLDRARRLLRKHNLPWRLVLDDVAGQHGKLLWRLQQHPLQCVECHRLATIEVYYSGTHLPYCRIHEAAHNRKVRHLRVSAANS
jgi:hypothetical protein